MRTQSPADILIGTAAERFGEQATASVGTMFYLEVAPFTLSVFDGAGGRTDYQPGAGGLVLPLAEIAFGTGVGTGSSPRYTFDPLTSLLTLSDSAGVSLFVVNGAALTRTMAVRDELGVTVFGASGLAAARGVTEIDSANTVIANTDTKAATRTRTVFDPAGVPIEVVDTKAAARTMEVFDSLAKTLSLITTLAATRGVGWTDQTGLSVLALDLVAATKKITAGVSPGANRLEIDLVAFTVTAFDAANNPRWVLDIAPGNTTQVGTMHAGSAFTCDTTARFGSYLVAALPVGAEGFRVYASDGRKVGEGPGLGTGVPVYFSGAKWRVYSTDAQVLA